MFRYRTVKSESAEHKGKLIMEEEKLSGKTIVVLSILVVAAYVAIMFWLFCPYDCFLFLMTLMMPLLFFPHLVVRKYPFAVYENGFDAPVEMYRVLKGEKRFVPFGDVKKIQPYYGVTPSKGIIGYVVSTTDGREIKMIDPVNDGKMYEGGLKKGLGKKWARLYVPEPYGLLNDFDEDKMRKCLSKRRKWIVRAAYVASLLIVPFFVLIPFLLDHIILFMVFLSAAFIGGGFGMLIILENNVCRNKYELIARFRPDIAARLKSEDGVIDPAERAERFKREDWEKLQRVISFNPLLLLLVGAVEMMLGLSMTGTETINLFFFFIFAIGTGTILISLPLIFFIEGKMGLIRSIIEEEHRTGKSIIPDHFVIPKWMESWIPYRDAPNFSEDEWKKIAESSTPIDEKRLLLYFILMTSSFLLGFVLLILLSSLGLPGFVSILSFFVLTFSPIIWFMWGVRYRNIARRILTYEEETGEKVIPDRYRKRIEYAFSGIYRR